MCAVPSFGGGEVSWKGESVSDLAKDDGDMDGDKKVRGKRDFFLSARGGRRCRSLFRVEGPLTLRRLNRCLRFEEGGGKGEECGGQYSDWMWDLWSRPGGRGKEKVLIGIGRECQITKSLTVKLPGT